MSQSSYSWTSGIYIFYITIYRPFKVCFRARRAKRSASHVFITQAVTFIFIRDIRNIRCILATSTCIAKIKSCHNTPSKYLYCLVKISVFACNTYCDLFYVDLCIYSIIGYFIQFIMCTFNSAFN